MKISITTNNKVYTTEDELGFDSVNIDEAVEMFKGLLVSAGFHPSNVDDRFNTEYQWFTEEEREDNLQGHTNFSEKRQKEIEDWQNNLYNQVDLEHE